jgi:hypothetical protein
VTAAETAAPDATRILQEMSATLAAAKQLSFKATRHLDTGLIAGRNVPEDAKVKVLAQRPNKIAAESDGRDSARSFYADGQTATLVDRKMNLYATVPMKTSIDGLVAQLDTRFGFTPPLAEFVISDPYKEMSKQIRKSSVVGTEKISWTECYHLALVGDLADADLWVGVKDHLPRRLIATFKQPGQPQVRVSFSGWNLAASTKDQDFAFVPTKGAQKIPMKPIAESGKSKRKTN